MTKQSDGKQEYQKRRKIEQELILRCDCRKCHEEWIEWFEKSRIVGIVKETAYTGSHLEDKPCMYVVVEWVYWDDDL
jgi:hypothetical protein